MTDPSTLPQDARPTAGVVRLIGAALLDLLLDIEDSSEMVTLVQDENCCSSC